MSTGDIEQPKEKIKPWGLRRVYLSELNYEVLRVLVKYGACTATEIRRYTGHNDGRNLARSHLSPMLTWGLIQPVSTKWKKQHISWGITDKGKKYLALLEELFIMMDLPDIPKRNNRFLQ